MQNVEPIERDLDLPPGYWQLISYGRLEEKPIVKAAIWITAIFREVKLEEDLIVEWLPNIVERYLPAAEMILFETGCIFCTSTSKVLRAQYLSTEMVQTEIEIEFTNENCELIRRYWCDEEGRLFFNNPVCELTDNSNSYLLSAVCTNGQKILIPCTTVLQAFWARSSNLLSMLLDTRFLNFNHYVINTELSKFDTETGKAYLLLRQWSLDEDAKFLATIVFSENPEEAILRGQEISKRLCSLPPNFENDDDRYIAALPPHSSKVALEVWGLPVKSAKFGDYMFIQRVIKSSFEPTFKSLIYDRDNNGQQGTQDENESNDEASKNKDISKKPIDRPRNWSPPRFEGKSKFEFTSDLPSHDSTQESTKLGAFDQMFPNISNLSAKKLEKLTTEYVNVAKGQKESIATRWAKLLSVLPSTATSSSNAIKTTLSSAMFVRDYMLDTNTGDIKIYLSKLIAAYDDFKWNIGNSERNIQIIKPIFPWPRSPAAGGQLVFSLPGSIKEQNIAWLYTDHERTTRKRAICLEVTYYSEDLEFIGVGYIIDIEVRFSKPRITKDKNGNQISTQSIGSTSIIFVWRDRQMPWTGGEDGKIRDYEFREILKAIASNGGFKSARDHFPHGCKTQAKKHNANGISFLTLLEELKACVLNG